MSKDIARCGNAYEQPPILCLIKDTKEDTRASLYFKNTFVSLQNYRN